MDEAKAIIRTLLYQIYQMKGMFDDEDGAIEQAIQEAEDYLEVISDV